MAPSLVGKDPVVSEHTGDFGWISFSYGKRIHANLAHLVTYTLPALMDPEDAKASTGWL